MSSSFAEYIVKYRLSLMMVFNLKFRSSKILCIERLQRRRLLTTKLRVKWIMLLPVLFSLVQITVIFSSFFLYRMVYISSNWIHSTTHFPPAQPCFQLRQYASAFSPFNAWFQYCWIFRTTPFIFLLVYSGDGQPIFRDNQSWFFVLLFNRHSRDVFFITSTACLNSIWTPASTVLRIIWGIPLLSP